METVSPPITAMARGCVVSGGSGTDYFPLAPASPWERFSSQGWEFGSGGALQNSAHILETALPARKCRVHALISDLASLAVRIQFSVIKP
jgi:hypothetical protein